MPLSAEALKALIEGELATVSDARVIAHIRGMLVEPYSLLRDWDYGAPNQQYPCWMVLKDERSRSKIGYCEHGFGPRRPWGLLSSGRAHPSMGMDSAWYSSFLDAFFESFACVELPIWMVFRVEPDGARIPVTGEGAWQATWDRIYDLRSRDPTKRYECDHSVEYGQ